MLKAENPFDSVLGEIEKMLALIEKEAKADDEELTWCNSEREESHSNLKSAKEQILTLESEIDTLKDTIGAPETGLIDTIAATEESKEENYQNQVDETKARTTDNLAFQQDVKNLVAAQTILKKATEVLKKYYAMLEKKLEEDTSLLQRRRQEPPPGTWDK